MAAWYEAAEFECSDCELDPERKRDLGCNGPPIRADGTETHWAYPPGEPRVVIERCPTRYIEDSPEVWDLYRSGNFADWRLSLTEQERLPSSYLEAWALAHREQATANAERMKARRDG